MATAKATLNTAARIYGISSEGATLLGNRIANSPVALELVQIGAGGGVAVVNSFLTPDSPSTLTGLPVVDYWSMAFSISWNFRK